MSPSPTLSVDKLALVKNLYLTKKLCVREVADTLDVSSDAVIAFLRRHHFPMRTRREASQVMFEHKSPSFTKQKLNTTNLKELAIIGAMLYWGEGYKGNERLPANTVDFANSDNKMILLFLKFLRSVFALDEKRLRIYLYCYSNQDILKIIDFWSKITKIPKTQFTKPYVRNDFKATANKMPYGLIHIRYADKKLLLEIKSMIESYVTKYASVV